MNDDKRLIQLKASAGAGKTYALTERFLELLGGAMDDGSLTPACSRAGGDCHGWPEIMAVTFTNKAAAEMKARVVARLKARALGQDEGGDIARAWPRERAALWLSRILRHYQQLNIRTIDSLLNLLMRIFALETGLAPDFDIIFDVSEVFDELFDGLLDEAEATDGEARKRLSRALDTMLRLEGKPGFNPVPAFRARLTDVLRHRLHAPGPCESDPERIHTALLDLHNELLTAAKVLRPMLDGFAVKKHLLNYLDKLDAFRPGGSVPTSAMAEKAHIDECLNKASQGTAPDSLATAYLNFADAYAACATTGKILAKARDFAPFIQAADLLVDALARLRGERNVLLNDQSAPLVHAQLAGGGVPDAFCRMGSRLAHMLVDEFQDTNRAQWQALTPLAEECLSKGGSLELVGDVKQAIYSWRGGDSRLFDEVPDQPELRAMAEPLRDRLPNNWRSHRHVVEFNNTVFSSLEQQGIARATASAMLADTTPAHAVRSLADDIMAAFADAAQAVPDKHADTLGYVRLSHLAAETKQDLSEEIHDRLDDTLAEVLARRPHGDVAILVRKNDEAAMVADWCMGWNIPVITENSLSLGEHPLVRQIVAFLRFLDYPLDDLALWEFISGEDIFLSRTGLTKAALTDWLAELTERPLYPRFSEAYPAEAARFLSRYVKKAGFMTPYDAVSELMEDFCVEERHPGGAPFVRRFLEVIHAAEEQGYQSLAAFLDFWDESGGQEKVPLPDAVNAVRIMTIHQAKGLEFPVVVAPFHDWGFRTDGELARVNVEGMDLVAPLIKEMGQPYHDTAARVLLEQLNLLYVAWTRPREELYAFLPLGLTSQPPLVKALDVLTGPMAWQDEVPCRICEFGDRPDASDEGGTQRPEAPQGETPDRCAAPVGPDEEPEPPMSWLPRLKIHRHFSKDVPRDDLLGGGPVFDARARGTLVHDALDRLRRAGSALDPQHAARAAVAVHADTLPPGEARREEIAAEVRGILDWVLTIPDYPGWAERGHPECPILTPDGTEKRPDMLVTDPHETVVVEYKTGQPSPDHEEQVRDYMSLLSGIDGVAQDMRAVIIYLDLKTVTEVRP